MARYQGRGERGANECGVPGASNTSGGLRWEGTLQTNQSQKKTSFLVGAKTTKKKKALWD